jgi:hypothetical protein
VADTPAACPDRPPHGSLRSAPRRRSGRSSSAGYSRVPESRRPRSRADGPRQGSSDRSPWHAHRHRSDIAGCWFDRFRKNRRSFATAELSEEKGRSVPRVTHGSAARSSRHDARREIAMMPKEPTRTFQKPRLPPLAARSNLGRAAGELDCPGEARDPTSTIVQSHAEPEVRIHFPPALRWYGAGGEEMAPSSLANN